jgi:hypothetical protein
MRGMVRWGSVVLLLSLGLGGCGDDDPEAAAASGESANVRGDAAAISKVAVEAKEYSYSMPKEVEGGLVEFTITNVGKEPHIAALARIAAGKTFADVSRDLRSPTPPAEPSSEEIGGIAATSPGTSSNVTLALDAGSYYFVCFIPTADGTLHSAKGMVFPFEVTEPDGDPPGVPPGDVAVAALDFRYEMSEDLAAGAQVVELRNEGTQGHEITLLEFYEGKGLADLQAFFEDTSGPPPATFHGGPVVGKGLTARWTTPPLAAGGSYFLICLIPDPADGVPHALKGMLLPVAIA